MGHSVCKDNGSRHTSTTSSISKYFRIPLSGGTHMRSLMESQREKSGKYLLMNIIPWRAIGFRLHLDTVKHIFLA